MKIIPVLDILNGVAIQAIRGEREKYLPVRSILCESASPLEMAIAFKSFGFDELYIADLDAILGRYVNLALYKQIKTKTSLNLMVDAGVTDLEKAKGVLKSGVSRIIIGTETLDNLDFVKRAIRLFGEDRVIVSLDLKEGKVMSISEAIRSMDPTSLVKTLEGMGATRMIILDLARVGTGRGVNLIAVKKILQEAKVEVLAGGGISNIRDLEELKDVGVSGALIATALHTGKITAKELKSTGFLLQLGYNNGL
ncbi:MAG: Imidazole glycerol phosphate synthase subunit HisF [Candidatus Bathyarchaeota archaeon BA2]|nr:MAG: Imidazole glycerol phosphate synthase subunit HisF [Candidatus Bathyarchaeota archaeon BA2]